MSDSAKTYWAIKNMPYPNTEKFLGVLHGNFSSHMPKETCLKMADEQSAKDIVSILSKKYGGDLLTRYVPTEMSDDL